MGNRIEQQPSRLEGTESVAVIRNWMVCKGEPQRVTPPESRRPVLRGLVHGHEIYEDGALVTTSTIKGRVGSRLLVASGRLYELGDPDPAYEARFPGARHRLLDSRECVALMGTCPDCTCEAGRLEQGSSRAVA